MIRMKIDTEEKQLKQKIENYQQGGGTSDHSRLNNLDYENSGHTGFQPAGNYIEDSNYVHTDNNFTNDNKEKLDNLHNYDDTYVLGKINKIDEDLGITQQDVQELKNDVDNLEDTKADKTEIPDVSNFIDKSVNDLENYYLKSEVDELIQSGEYKAEFVGFTSEKASSSNKFDLNGKKKGIYIFVKDSSYLYCSCNMGDRTRTASFNIENHPAYDLVYLIIKNDVPSVVNENLRIGLVKYEVYSSDYTTQKKYIYDVEARDGDFYTGGSYFETQFVTRNKNQTINGIKTFSALPKSSVVPTNDDELVNKKYVDDKVGDIDTLLDDRQITYLITEFPASLDDNALYRIETDITYSGKTYSAGLYQVVNNDLEKIEKGSSSEFERHILTLSTTSKINLSDATTNKFIADMLNDFYFGGNKNEYLLFYQNPNNSSAYIYMTFTSSTVSTGGNVNTLYTRFSGNKNDTSKTFYGITYTSGGVFQLNFYVDATEFENRNIQNVYSTSSKTKGEMTISDSSLKIVSSNFTRTYPLSAGNTTSYTPTGDYNPATKKYVDDSIATAIGDIETELGGI